MIIIVLTMIHVDFITVGRMRDDAMLSLWNDYTKRLQWSYSLFEIDTKKPQDEEKKILDKIDPQAFLFVLDERGKSLGSIDFAKRLESISLDGCNKVQFLIGGADGHTHNIKNRANFLLSFGIQTWPHMLARIMLAEQVYRAQQILAGHPYHRE